LKADSFRASLHPVAADFVVRREVRIEWSERAVLAVSAVLIWRALNGPSLFIAGDPETNVFALQVFLIGLAIPVLLLGAAIEETRRAEQTTRDNEEQISFAATSANIGLCSTTSRPATSGRPSIAAACLAWWPMPRSTGKRSQRRPSGRPGHVEGRHARRDPEQRAAECEFRVVLPGVQIRWMVARAHAAHDDEHDQVRLSGLVADITARKNAEHQIELQRRELAHLTRVSVVGELSGAIAHELNQPLTAILANARRRDGCW